MQDQLYIYMNTFQNELRCGFRKAHSTQHALFKLLQAWQKELDNLGFIETTLMDLSKAYDCLPHDLLIAKLGAYDLDRSSLRLLMDYLNSRKQKLVHPTASCQKLNEEFRKVPYWDPYYSTYLYTTCSLSYKSLIFAILRMVILCTLVEQI